MKANNYILSIAGFDPSSGAGLTSDIKTFEAHGCYGVSVCTAVTVQNDMTFKSCEWMDVDVILAQIDTLFERFKIDVVKIGLVKNWEMLLKILENLRGHNPKVFIVLDPVLKASAGFDFHQHDEVAFLEKILGQIQVITPNYEEIEMLFPSKSMEETIAFIRERTHLYLKGGHRKDKKGWDELHLTSHGVVNIPPGTDTVAEKHGSGCVLSSALASQIALGNPLESAAKNAKTYTEDFLNSNDSLLGVHKRNREMGHFQKNTTIF